MAPIKFEDFLKEKLEQRKLQPSTNAWEKLQSKLDTNQTKKNNKPFWWLGIAASFIGILIVTSVFFNNETDTTIVDTEEAIITIENETPKIFNDVEQVAVEEPQVENPLINTKVQKVDINPVLQKQENQLINRNVNEAVVQTETKANENQINKKESIDKALTFEDLKLQEVVAQVQALKKANNVVSDAEINALLDQAQKEIALHKLYNESTKKVDANALLQGVEADLEQSFRVRAFKAIKSGYNYVKTTVAERNN
ncbi:MAG: hypothetical protein L3J25_10365 [Flavobacteriaceae bacterium]|nr:hypothetical protein [Flavobacteriaceae bacterium]